MTAAERPCVFDERMLCEGGVGICSAKIALIQNYEQSTDAADENPVFAGPDFDSEEESYYFDHNLEVTYPRAAAMSADPQWDGVKLHMRLAEYKLAGRTCTGETTDGHCPTQVNMAENKTRARVLSVVRKVLKRI